MFVMPSLLSNRSYLVTSLPVADNHSGGDSFPQINYISGDFLFRDNHFDGGSFPIDHISGVFSSHW